MLFNNKTFFITGGTGSFGKHFIKTILRKFNPKKVIIYSRDELKQYEMQQLFPDTCFKCIRYFIGDVRDINRLHMALEDVDYVEVEFNGEKTSVPTSLLVTLDLRVQMPPRWTKDNFDIRGYASGDLLKNNKGFI